MEIKRHDRLTGDALRAAWELYYTAFEDIDGLAVQRHLMYWEEFGAVADDVRVQKWIVTDQAGDMTGLSVITGDLDAWPLVSPRYFERHYPREYADRAVWYIGFVCVRQNPRPEPHTFRELIGRMAPQVESSRGIAVMDWCKTNVEALNLPRATSMVLSGYNPDVTHRTIDYQQFDAYRFDGGPL